MICKLPCDYYEPLYMKIYLWSFNVNLLSEKNAAGSAGLIYFCYL